MNVVSYMQIQDTEGYTLNGTPGKRQYVAFRVKYAVEEGMRYKYDQNRRKCVSKNKYKITKPISKEYKLITTKKKR